jgi:hypothetical protein
VEENVLFDLVEHKTKLIVPHQGKWRVYYLGFSRSGWSDTALAYQARLNRQLPGGENWSCAGMRLLDLAQVDNDLAQWSDAGPDFGAIRL